MNQIETEIVIVGGGPAGLGAALYAARDRFDTYVLDKFVPGGQINLTDRIENYPGHARVSGPDLVEAMYKQASDFGAKFQNNSEVTALNRLPDGRIEVQTAKNTYLAKVVILAPGSDYRKLGVPGEDEFRQAGGVSYCGLCDAPFYRDKEVVSIGGGNTAVEETLHLAKFCSKVTIVHRRDEFRATKVLAEELIEESKKGIIDIRYDSVLTSINGSDHVESATLKNVKTDQIENLTCDGVFIFVGMIPNTDFLKGFVEINEHGYIRCDTTFMRTAVPGVFTAGDCRENAAMQLATATADGVAAAVFMKQYFRDPKWWNQDNPFESAEW
jgi:thioredoxin reductase (NADPH)